MTTRHTTVTAKFYLFVCLFSYWVSGYEFNWSSPFNAEVKNEWGHTSVPPIRLLGVYMENFTVYFYLTMFSVTCVASGDTMVVNKASEHHVT
jgi:hypothetical protein